MYLKKIEICGFKSFADKTTLEFDTGISGIIGPNGCGKSNISDSILWCLGEQNAKAIRGKTMQDVIFSGTTSRSPGGMAEVSLIFDNSQNVLPISYSEVVVTRRLFRNGESEYYINKGQCRLKDIRDLFLDTGIGSNSYSVMAQGKVEFLTTAKPDERRYVFEEAAGVAKYKARREETLRKLEKIDVDMSRLSDSLEIHKSQLSALETAAKKVKQYNQHKEDLAKYEVADLIQKISFGISEIEKLKQDLDPKIKDYEASNILAIQKDAETVSMRLLLDEKNNKFVEIQKELGEIKAEIGICDNIIQHSSQREREIRTDQEELGRRVDENKLKLTQYEEQFKNFNTDDSSLVSEVSLLEQTYQANKNSYNFLKTKLAEFETRENEIRTKFKDIEEQKDIQLNLKAKISENKIRLDSDVASAQRVLSRLETEIEPANREIAKLNEELNVADVSVTSLAAEKEEIEKSTVENEEKIKNLEEDLIRYSQDLAAADSRIKTLKEFDIQDPVRNSIREILELGVAKGPISSLITLADSNYENTVALALGDKLNYLVCRNSQDAEQAISHLEENNLSCLSFIISDRIPENTAASNVVEFSNGYKELIKCLNFSTEYEKVIKFICSGAIIFKNKIYGDAVVSGGAGLSEKLVLVDEQVKKFEEKFFEAENKISFVKKEVENLKTKLEDLRLRKSQSGNNFVRLNTQIESKKNQIEEKQNEIKTFLEEIENHKKEIAHKTTELLSFGNEMAAPDNILSNLEREESELNTELQKLESEIRNLRKEEEAITPLMISAKSDFDKKYSELDNKKNGQQYILDNIENMKRQIQSDEDKILRNDNELKEYLNSQENETIKIQNLYEDQAQKDAESQVVLSDKENLQSEIEQKNLEVRELRTKVENSNLEVNKIQVDLKNFEYQKSELEKRLSETYNQNYEEIKNNFDGVVVNSEEIVKIKRKIELLGNVNLGAQEEYDTLEQRYNFLIMQRDDLLKAKEDLLETMKKIDNSTIENFKKTFDIVKTNFKEVYGKLFGGGEADLELTDENNLLESGIDIRAQPPGKKLQNISLCSGGEKALTAVALLFAFFMVKPSPFCILDEIDAPLDDANVGRFNAIVKEFAQKTQFLVVTHNKRTMEMADILYGVTMETQGISKIISARIEKQDKFSAQ
jgi:chromosome segregation protein